MNELFPRDRDIVLLGTDANEWITGYELISRFIYADWKLGLKRRSGIFAHGKLREIALAIETLLTGQAPDSDLPLPGDVPIEHR
jgi:hypothetical protein